MKAHLLYANADLDVTDPINEHHTTAATDLGLDSVLATMAGGDPFFMQVAAKVLSESLTGRRAMRYRQQVLRDCLENPDVVRTIYDLANAAIAAEHKEWTLGRSPELLLSRSVSVLTAFIQLLRQLRDVASENAQRFSSPAFGALFDSLQAELDDQFFAAVDAHLKALRFQDGLLLSAELGAGFKANNVVARLPDQTHRSWRDRLRPALRNPYAITIPQRDDAGARALGEMRARGVEVISNALGQSVEHVLSFFVMLRIELAFYLGCLNLYRELTRIGMPLCFPDPTDSPIRNLKATQLYDAGLALRLQQPIVGNDVHAEGIRMVVVTGANQGGKSTFLRSLGLAQLLMQAGMFVPAARLSASPCSGIFTHFKREEDETLSSGKFDEELNRMTGLVDAIRPNGLLLMNESFSSTNETEGAEIGTTVVDGLRDAGVNIAFVTHSYELARRLRAENRTDAKFLRAQREADGSRTFHIVEADPLPTSFGADLYRRIFPPPPANSQPTPDRRSA
jgi:hypothetical protein